MEDSLLMSIEWPGRQLEMRGKYKRNESSIKKDAYSKSIVIKFLSMVTLLTVLCYWELELMR